MKKIYIFLFLLFSIGISYSNTLSENQIKTVKEKSNYLQHFNQLLKSPIENNPVLTSALAANHIDSITLDNGGRKIFQYNNNDQIIDFKYYEFTANDVILKEHHTFEYDTDGNLTLFVFNMLTDYEGWIVANKDEYTYYSDGTLKSQISWDYDIYEENPYSKSDYTYSANKTTLNTFSWNEDTQDWENSGYEIIEIDNDRILNAEIYLPNEETGDIELAMKMEFGYNNSGFNTYINSLFFDEDANEWVIMLENTTEYNSDNNPTLEKETMYYGDFEIVNETRYTYNSNGQITKEENYTSDFFTVGTTLSSQIEYTYNNGKLASEIESSAEYTGEMVAQLKNEFTYQNNSSANGLIIPDVNTSDLYDEDYYQYGLISKVTQSIFDWDTEELQVSQIASYFYSDDSSTPEESDDATLSDLMIDGETIDGFNASTQVYTIELTEGTQDVPVVSATTHNENATYSISHATALPGSTTVDVTAEDGTQLAYIVNFELSQSSDATLSEIQIDGEAISNFNPATLSYNYGLPNGSTLIPEVTASASNVSATVEIFQANNLPGIATILVTAEDGITINTYNVTFFIIASNDASLSAILINGDYLNDFDASTYTYTVVLPFGTSTIPEISANATDNNASVLVTQATELTGSAIIVVTAVDGETQNTYTISFEIGLNNIATLSDLSLNGSSINDFDAEVYNYEIILDNGTTEIPEVTASATDENASVEIIQASELPGEANVVVTAEDGETQNTYTVNFNIELSSIATLSNLSIDGTSIENFDASIYTYDIVLADGTTEIPQISATTSDENASIEINQATELPGEASIVVTAEDGTSITYTISFTISVGISEKLMNEINVYPNPFKDHLYIDIPEHQLLKSITIYNSIGKQVYKNDCIKLSNQLYIETNDFVNGLYFLSYYFADGRNIQFKISKF